MTLTRGITVLLLALVVFGFAAQIIHGPAAASPPAAATTPQPEPALARRDKPVRRALTAVQRAFNAGDVSRLCRAGALVDPAVVRQQNRQPGGCTTEIEGLLANQPPLRLTVQRLALRADLATAAVTTSRGASVSVDVIRRGNRWLLSFSGGDDPLSALAGIG